MDNINPARININNACMSENCTSDSGISDSGISDSCKNDKVLDDINRGVIDRNERNEQLASQITQLAGQINAATYRFLKLLAEFDQNKGWFSDSTVKSCAHWLNWRCGIAMGAARERVRVARCLEDLPETNRAFSEGSVSYSKVRAMTRVATNDNEDFLLMIAQHGTASHMEQTVRKFQRVKHLQAKNRAAQQHDTRELVFYEDYDGMWVIHARLPAEAGALVKKALEQIVDEQDAQRETHLSQLADLENQHTRQQTKQTQPAEQSDQVDQVDQVDQAEQTGQTETCERAIQQPEFCQESVSAETPVYCYNVETPGEASGVDDYEDVRPTFPQKRADAIAALAEHYIATRTNGEGIASLNGGERCQLMLHMDIGMLTGLDRHEHPENCHLDNNWIHPDTARRLACDAAVVAVIEDGEGNLLNIGRRSRTIPPAIRRALTMRDEGCRFPGCCETRYVDAHHIQHWVDGGETSMNNLVTLCRHHHRKLHDGAFAIHVTATNTAKNQPELEFRNPAGEVIELAYFPQFPEHADPATTPATIESLFPDIDDKTLVPEWWGHNPDYKLTLSNLMAREAGNVSAETRRFCLGREPLQIIRA